MKPRAPARVATPAGVLAAPLPPPDWRLQVFNVFLFLAGVGGMFFRMARDNDDLVRMGLVLISGSAATLLLATRRPRLPGGLLLPCLGFAAAMFLTSLPFVSLNAAESFKEFLKIACYLIVFLTLAEVAEVRTGVALRSPHYWTAAALGFGAVFLGWKHSAFTLWSNEQVVASMAVTVMTGAVYTILLAPGSVRDGVVKGCGAMGLTACVLGILQFYHLDPLRPWDPPQPYNIWVRSGGPDALNLLAGLTAGQLQVENNKLLLVLPRILGIYGNPDFFGAYLLQFIPLSMTTALLARGRARWWGGILTVLLLVTLFLTAVWGAFFALFLTGLFMAPLLGYVTGRTGERRAVRATGVLLAGGAAFLIVVSFILHASGTKSSAINERLVKLRMAAEMWRREPLLGVGLNAYKSWYPALEQEVRLKHNLPFEALGSSFTQENRTHNDHAQMLCETGVLGFGMFLWLMAALVSAGLRRCREWRTLAPDDLAHLTGLMGGVLVVLVYALPNFPFHIVSSAGTFWIMAGLLASYAVRPAPGRALSPADEPPPGEVPRHDGRFVAVITAAGAITVLLTAMFSVRLFVGTLEYKRADYFSRLVRPAQPREAAVHYQTALDLDPSNAQYHYDYGAMCFNAMAADAELAKRAGPLLEESLALGFLNEDLAYGLAHIAEVEARAAGAAGKSGAAPPSDEAADVPESRPLAIRALDSVAPFDVAPLAHRLPKSARALLWYTLATRLNERHDPSRRGRMIMLQNEMLPAEQAKTQRRWTKARALYAEALRRDPANFLAAMNLGTLSVTPFGDVAGGIRLLEDAARIGVNEPNAWLALGRGYAAGGRMPDARRALERAAALDPKTPEIQGALAHLRAIESGEAPAPGAPPPPAPGRP